MVGAIVGGGPGGKGDAQGMGHVGSGGGRGYVVGQRGMGEIGRCEGAGEGGWAVPASKQVKNGGTVGGGEKTGR